MLRGLYTGASGMLAGIERVDTISNNIANAATPAYKKTKAVITSFSELVARVQTEQDNAAMQGNPPIGAMGLGAKVDSTRLILEQGPLRFTDNPLNVAINGPGFFVLDTPTGERYTRDGNFMVDGDGWLVTADGNRVLTENGPVQVAGPNVSINSNGAIIDGDRVAGNLRVVDFANATGLVKEGRNLFAAGSAGTPIAVATELAPGSLEESNVSAVAEMAELIAATRFYEANQKVIQAEDDALGKAVTEVGKV